ncbi:MAG: NADH:flavin oxidoreductase [Lachnospiraceae bacterium]|nr:NADH:flavin oxidoreductase [Lachnospiraceae bacterium]
MAFVTDPITINKTVLKNRITFAPTVKFDYAGEDGKATSKHIEHYKERAMGGAGLIVVEATAVTPGGRFGKNHMGLWEDSQIPGQREITEACHEHDTPVIIQLNHVGVGANPECGPAIGPSEHTNWHGTVARAMTISEIKDMERSFVDAALRAKDAGYDGIQLHGCHGYLINQFVTKNVNKRDDEYGGSVENRARFGANIIRDIRKECGDDFLISIRTVGADPDIEDCILVAEEYVKAGCDYLQVSHGMGEIAKASDFATDKYNTICALGVKFHEHFKGRVPVSCVNSLFTPDDIKYLIENDLCDTVDLARAILADPAFPKAVLEGGEYTPCFKCKACQYGPFTAHKCPAAFKRGVVQ